MASFVLDIGTTSFAQTYPATTHSNTTNPIEANTAVFGIMASYATTSFPPATAVDIHDDVIDDGDSAPTDSRSANEDDE
jgi:hypothetical protein